MKKAIIWSFCLLLASAVVDARPSERSVGIGDQIPDFSLYDTKRRLRSLVDYETAEAVALVFFSVECPLVKLYVPKLRSLHQDYQDRGVQFLLINADQGDPFNRVAGFAWENAIEFPVLKDFAQTVAIDLDASRTPEVFVIDSSRRLRYRGRIDDQYTVTHRRPVPGNEELKDALEAILNDEPIAVTTTKATGCVIEYPDNPYSTAALTYTDDIADIVAANCLECHRRGQVGQISLTSYRQLKRFSSTVREVVLEERMPPWHADPEYGHFVNDRSLTEDDRYRLLAWIDQGSPQGTGAAEPSPEEGDSGSWTIGEPDLIVSIPKKQQVPATGVVDYRYFRVDPGFTEDVWVQAAEAQPGNPEVVHHIIAYISEPDTELFDQTGETSILVGWAPGDMPARHAPGTARRIPAGATLLFELHYTPNGQAAEDQSRIGIRFAKRPPEREIRTNVMWQRKIRIPAGEPWHVDRATVRFPEDVRILSLMPHMHLRGIAARYELTRPDGSRETLLSTPYYDFNWQSVYRFAEPLRVAAGSRLTIVGVWDNSAENPNNPDPQKDVIWGEQTWDEMLNGWVNYVAENESAKELTSAKPER